MEYSLVAIPQVDTSLLPLYLPPPDGINNGGYKVPSFQGDWRPKAVHEYSPIDLLVAGLEARRRNLKIMSLTSFFDRNRYVVPSEHDVYVVVCKDNCIAGSIAHFKSIITHDKDKELLDILRRNAPLTFKWVVI